MNENAIESVIRFDCSLGVVVVGTQRGGKRERERSRERERKNPKKMRGGCNRYASSK